ncbi:MAG TPA: CAP domain-containing protein, partial [Candidatus Binataceae bacterium]|nr:CAP domain-containing protein [Candidatus Binataceae bacterium]
AENIYMEGSPDPSEMPDRAVKAWMASPPHRENMLSANFRETGIGVARSSDGKTYVTQDFLR